MAPIPEPASMSLAGNLLDTAGIDTRQEDFADILQAPGVRVERIVSHGQITAVDQPYVQAWDEWVLVLAGEAHIEVEGQRTQLTAGDHLLIPAHHSHRVLYTAMPTIWLAVHIGEKP